PKINVGEKKSEGIKLHEISYGYEFASDGKSIKWTVDVPVSIGGNRINEFSNVFTTLSNSGLGKPTITKVSALGREDSSFNRRIQNGQPGVQFREQEFDGSNSIHHGLNNGSAVGRGINRDGTDTLRYEIVTPITEFKPSYAIEIYSWRERAGRTIRKSTDRVFAVTPESIELQLRDEDEYIRQADVSPNLTLDDLRDIMKLSQPGGEQKLK
ncbi:hypothetical protein, partial [Histophilus somni]|uniref:hypothetical protein n=1 Tax=Histophilus somni TaxID=731 RepID=UPI00201EC0F2